jgi:flavodoxin
VESLSTAVEQKRRPQVFHYHMNRQESMERAAARTLIVLHSYHHQNTARIAEAIAGILGARVVAAQDMEPSALDQYDLVGFGSGIDSGRHYGELLAAAEKLPGVRGQKAFIFSTSAIHSESKMDADHSALRNLLKSKGYSVLGEFSCTGFNTNSFLKFFGGMNRGRPNGDDLRRAARFAESLAEKMN